MQGSQSIAKAKVETPVNKVIPVTNMNNLTVMTYNANRDSKNFDEIISLIRKYRPDLCCLQEVTVDLYNQIKSKSIIYKIFQVFIDEGNKYGTCILCLKETIEVKDPYYYDYPNNKMGRRLVGCDVAYIGSNFRNEPNESRSPSNASNDKPPTFHILTTHLESLPENEKIREKQFNFLVEATKEIDELILACDLSLHSYHEQVNNKIMDNRFHDLWRETGMVLNEKEKEKEKVNDIKENEVNESDRISLYRPYKILYRSNTKASKKTLIPISIEEICGNRLCLIGTFGIP
jgi:mRNA deadenylase 3'-5' endonuclease subunit Ccr4